MTPRDVFEKTLHLTDSEVIEDLSDACIPLHLAAGDFLIREGEKPAVVPFLLKGIVRGFLFDVNGREIQTSLLFSPQSRG